MGQAHSLRDVLRLLRSEADRLTWTCTFATLTLVAAGGALAASAPLALKHMVDAAASIQGTSFQGSPALVRDAALYLLVLCSSRLINDLRPLLSGAVDQRIQARLTVRFFDHLMRLPMAYVLRRRSGELVHSVDIAAAGCQLVFAHLANSIVPTLVEVITMTVILVELGHPALVWLFAVTAVVYLVIFGAGARSMSTHARAVSDASLHVHAHVNDGVTHAETLRCFTAEAQARAELKRSTGNLEKRWFHFNRLNAGIGLAASATFMLSMAGCLYISASAVMQGTLSAGGFLLSSVYMLQMVRPIEVLGSAARDLSRSVGFVKPLLEILAEPCEPMADCEMPRQPGTGSCKQSAPAIRFQDLSFGYAPDRLVLKGLNLDIKPGLTTAIVGRSGSGKSTIARLLMRLYSQQSGQILFDGVPIETFPVALLRARIGLVPQDTALLHAPIADNIALGVPGAKREDVAQAAADAQLVALIDSLPEGYDTPVGERGLKLSGGERQRISIARAVLRRPAIYLLDEPTSMLDGRTEASIQECLRRLTLGRTTIVIAHRLSTVMQADEIVVLDAGQVREQGTHHELLELGGLYAELWRHQTDGPASPPSSLSRAA